MFDRIPLNSYRLPEKCFKFRNFENHIICSIKISRALVVLKVCLCSSRSLFKILPNIKHLANPAMPWDWVYVVVMFMNVLCGVVDCTEAEIKIVLTFIALPLDVSMPMFVIFKMKQHFNSCRE